MVEYHFKTPISEADVRKPRAGDIVYLSGTMFTARDAAHERMLDYYKRGEKLPIKMEGLALFHCGPIVKKVDGKYVVISAGPTTSERMEMFEATVIEKSGVRIIVGKGGMGLRTAEALKKFGAIYCAFTGGTGALAAKAIKEVKYVEWLDLGIPEAIWIFEVKDFGPLIVAIDTYGNDLYANAMEQIKRNREIIYQKIG